MIRNGDESRRPVSYKKDVLKVIQRQLTMAKKGEVSSVFANLEAATGRELHFIL